jgi:hypothetical protein
MADDDDQEKEPRISGKDATYAAIDAQKYPPVKVEAPGDECLWKASNPRRSHDNGGR